MSKFNQSTTWQPLPPQETTTSVPARAASFQSDVLVPLGQALVTAVLLGGALGFIVYTVARVVMEWQGWGRPNLLHIMLGMICLVLVAVWLWLLIDHRQLLWAVETLTHKDIDGDGYKGQPKQTLGVAVQDKDGTTHFWDAEWLGLTDEQLVNWARALRIGGRKLTEAANAKDESVFPDGLKQFREVRTKLESAGAIRRKSDGQTATFELTKVGEVGFDRILEYAEDE